MKAADGSMNTYKEIDIISDGLKKYPNSPELKISLAFSLSMVNRISSDEDEKEEAVAKAIKLCKEVADGCGDIKQTDSALNMLRRIYCDIGKYQQALDSVEKISAESYRRRIIGKAQVLQYRKDYPEHKEFTENSLLECFLAMDQLFELKRKSLLELGEYEELLYWCYAHEKLLTVFDAGCEDFYVSHRFWNHNAKAQAYKKLGDKELCLCELKILASLTKYFYPDAKGENYQIGLRNPIYFSSVKDPNTQEEFMTGIDLSLLLSGYADFFGNDKDYLRLKDEYDI